MNKFIEAALENTEAFIDAFASSELAQSIPVVGTVVKVFEGTQDIRDRLFAAKVKSFIEELESVPKDERERFKAILDRDSDSLAKAGETVILVLDKLNDIDKATLLGFYFSCLLRNELDNQQFRRMANAIDAGFIDDLKRFLLSTDCPNRSQDNHMDLCITPELHVLLAVRLMAMLVRSTSILHRWVAQCTIFGHLPGRWQAEGASGRAESKPWRGVRPHSLSVIADSASLGKLST